MLWIGVLPALLVFWIMSQVRESPVWLERQKTLRDRHEQDAFSLGKLFTPALLPATLQTSLLMGAFLFSNQSITFWYARFLSSIHREPLPFLLAPGGYLVTRLVGFAIPSWVLAAFPFAFPVGIVVYYLVWKHLIGFLNDLLGIA